MNVALSHLLDHFVVVFNDGIGWSHHVCVVEKLCKCYDQNDDTPNVQGKFPMKLGNLLSKHDCAMVITILP
jgi:hypothetical protein